MSGPPTEPTLSGGELTGLEARVADEIQKAIAVSGLDGVPVYEPLGTIASMRFVATQLIAAYKNDLRLRLTTGKLGRLQRRLRGKKPLPDSPEDYWPIGPHLLWNWHEKTHPAVVAYDNETKRFVRHDFASYQLRIVDEIARFIAATKPREVLELGCGYGRNVIHLHKLGARFPEYVGLDLSPVAIFASIANLQHEYTPAPGAPETKHSFFVGDFRKSELETKSVDATFSVWNLPYGCGESPAAMEAIADEIVRVTRRRALLIEPDLSPRYGIHPHRGSWKIHDFCAILRSKGCTVSKRVVPIQFNWLVPVCVLTVDMPLAE